MHCSNFQIHDLVTAEVEASFARWAAGAITAKMAINSAGVRLLADTERPHLKRWPRIVVLGGKHEVLVWCDDALVA